MSTPKSEPKQQPTLSDIPRWPGESDRHYADRLIRALNSAPVKTDLSAWTGSPRFTLSPGDYRS